MTFFNRAKEYPAMFIAKLKTRHMPEAEYIIEVKHYEYNNINTPAIIILSKEGEKMMVASVNLEKKLAPNHILIKDWSENEGICDALMKADLIGVALKNHPTGFVAASEHAMRGELLKAWDNYQHLQGL